MQINKGQSIVGLAKIYRMLELSCFMAGGGGGIDIQMRTATKYNGNFYLKQPHYYYIIYIIYYILGLYIFYFVFMVPTVPFIFNDTL